MKDSVKRVVWVTAWVVMIIVSTTDPVFAGAWTAKQGDMYCKLTFNLYEADEMFNDSGNKAAFRDSGEFSDTNISTYMEYGITDKITLLGSLSYKRLKSENNAMIYKTRGFSDLDLGVKYRLASGNFGVISAQGLIKIPEFYDDDTAVALGNNQYDTEIRLLYGKSLYPFVPGYINIEAGYRLRAEEPSDEFRYLLELGFDITDAVYSRVKLDGIIGMDNNDTVLDYAGNPTTTLDYDLGKLDLALGVNLSKQVGIELGYRGDIYGENTASGENVSLSLVVQY